MGLFSEPVTGFARVAVERAIDRYPDGLTYAIPESIGTLAPGDRVLVPLGRGDAATAGYVIEVDAHTELDPGRLKPVAARDRTGLALPADLVELARWISRYYATPIGMTLASMLPAAVKHGVGTRTRVHVDLGTPPAEDAKLSAQQRAVLDALDALAPEERPIEIGALADRAGVRTTGPIKRLIERGTLASVRRTTVEAKWSRHMTEGATPAALTDAQARAVRDIGSALQGGFSSHLLAGVTGSGKTEVYLRLIERTLELGLHAILLVPEIALTPQTGGRILGRFPDRHVAVLHSGLTAAQRHQQWVLAASGEADIIVGARSAVFAPIAHERLGLIVVDEEHDSSYKQDQAPRYHGRDVALKRGQLAGCPVVLGSATPSLETWDNATARGRHRLHVLPERIPGMRLPRVRIVDLVEERRLRGNRPLRLMGPTLEAAARRTLDAGHQVLLLLNRRGYSGYISCSDARCGWVMQCDDCDVSMVEHRHRAIPAGGFVRCHHCQREQRLPRTCPTCGRKLMKLGLGTQRVEEELAATFPDLEVGVSLVRVDSDTMRSARDLHDVLERFGAGTVRMLVGTQMIAKGLDFPNVRLVGVINGDTALNLPDFRAAERTFQLVSQVAGRCGRVQSDAPDAAGLVIVQTFQPEDPAIVRAAAHDYVGFAEQELRDRRQVGLPPASRMTRVVVRHEDVERCTTEARALATALERLAHPGIQIRPAAPCPITRIAGRHRWQVELIAPDAAQMLRMLDRARDAGVLKPGALMAVDVDPVAMM